MCGVEEQNEGTEARLIGISASEAKRLRDRILELNRTHVKPPVEMRFESVAIDGNQEALIVWAGSSGEVHFFKEKVFVRLGDKTTAATIQQHSELVLRTAHLDWLDQPCPGATLDDISAVALVEISKGRRPIGGTGAEFLQPGALMFGSAEPLVSKVASPAGDVLTPNRFAILLIGDKPERFLPGAFVKIVRFRGISRADAIFSSNEFFGPIPLLLREVMTVLSAEVSMITDQTQPVLSGGQNRWRYSEDALKEIPVNALAHRDYRDSHSTKIYVFADRIEFESPGGFVTFKSIDEAKGKTHWRNRALARYLLELKWAQEAGTRLQRAIEDTKELTGVEPKFEVGSSFKVTVPAYAPPSLRLTPREESVSPHAGILSVSIGHGIIDPEVIRGSNTLLRDIAEEAIFCYRESNIIMPEQWPDLIHELRNWIRDRMEDSRFHELHLFYRGPVALGPLFGALSVARKPLAVYVHDDSSNLYLFIYRVDRMLLQGP